MTVSGELVEQSAVTDSRENPSTSPSHRLVRGTARYRTGRAVERRPLDWASRSLGRESEEVIVVEVWIEEMFRSGRNQPRDYKTSRGRRGGTNEVNKTTLRSARRSLFKKDLTGPTLLEMSG